MYAGSRWISFSLGLVLALAGSRWISFSLSLARRSLSGVSAGERLSVAGERCSPCVQRLQRVQWPTYSPARRDQAVRTHQAATSCTERYARGLQALTYINSLGKRCAELNKGVASARNRIRSKPNESSLIAPNLIGSLMRGSE